jgi:hypothetical protein
MAETPHFFREILYTAFFNIYEDLKEAEKFIRSTEWVSATFIKPGALSNDQQTGHVISMTEAKTPISFLDLAAGMIEVADEAGDRYDGQGVAVNATGDVAFPWQASVMIVRGLVCYYFPFLYPYVG